MTKTIARDALKGHIDAGDAVTIVEALPEKYFNKAHLPGALRINPDEVADKAPRLLPDKAARIVVYCADAACRNSAQVADALTAMGYADVLEYVEGKADWIAAGFPVEGLGRRAA